MTNVTFENFLKVEDAGVAPAQARVCYLPERRGEYHNYGGEALLMIGEAAILVGSSVLAKEMAKRWNAAEASQGQIEEAEGR